MKKLFAILCCLLPLTVMADEIKTDSLHFIPDSVEQENYRYMIDLKRKPDAIQAVWLGAILPGAGQIYNRSYWKLPIVYGAFMGCGYAISWTQGKYTDYKTAYKDLYLDNVAGTVNGDDLEKSYVKVLPEGYTIGTMGGVSNYINTLRNRQNVYRRYRDLSVVATVAVYALSLIDAYVDAQLFDFDISEELSINIRPQIYLDSYTHQTAEMKLAITF